MSVKYKIENAKLNKKLVGDEITVSKIKKPHGDGPRGPKQPTTREILVDFIKEQRAFNKKVDTRFKTIDNQFKEHGWTK